MRISIILVALAWLAGGSAVQAQVLLDSGHVDLVPGYEVGTGWDVKIGYDTLGIDYATSGAPGATDWAIIGLNSTALAPRPAGSQFNFIGVPAGAPIFRVTQAGFPLLLGIGAEDNMIGIFDTYTESDLRLGTTAAERTGEWIRFKVKGFTGPGAMSVWFSDIGGPTPYFTSADGIDAADVLYALNGSHADYNWAFTEPGTYHLVLEASALIGGVRSFSGDYDFTFSAVPEPSSLALVGLVGIGWLGRRLRRRRNDGLSTY